MDTIYHAIQRARLRLFLQNCVWVSGWLVLGGLMAAALVLLADRLLPVQVPAWVYLAIAGLVLLAAPVLAWRRLPDVEQAAAVLDDRLQLKDRLSSALYAESLHESPFARQVIDDAEQAAATLSVRQALPLKLGRSWGWVPVGAGVIALLFVLVPVNADPFGLRQSQTQQAAADEQTDEAQRRIVEAHAQIRDLDNLTDEADAAQAEDLLNQLAELSQRDLRNPALRRESQAQLSRLQERLAADQEQKRQALRTIRNAMSRIETGQPGPADRFAEALRRGDFDAAQRELEALADGIRSGAFSDEEKQALQQQLQNMAEQLEQLAQQQEQRQQELQQQIREQLEQQGLSQEQIDQLQQQGFDQQAVQDALQQQHQQQGMSEDQARQQAQQIQQQQQQAQQQGTAGESSSSLGESMGQMAQSLDSQGQNGQQGEQGQGFEQGAWQGQQQLGDIAQMQQAMQRMGMSEQQVQQAMQQLSQQQQGEGQDEGQGAGEQQQASGGTGPGAGSGDGGDPLGEERRIEQYQREARDRAGDGQGRIIASWDEQGEMASGDPTVAFDQAVSEARSDAERAVSEDRVPRRYHGAIRDYFQQLPESADEARRAPSAPR